MENDMYRLDENDVAIMSTMISVTSGFIQGLVGTANNVVDQITRVKMQKLELEFRKIEADAEIEKWKIKKEILFEFLKQSKYIFDGQMKGLQEHFIGFKDTIDKLLLRCDQNIEYLQNELSKVDPKDIVLKNSYVSRIENLEIQKNKHIYEFRKYLRSQDKLIMNAKVGDNQMFGLHDTNLLER
jgi:hypothetical protein